MGWWNYHLHQFIIDNVYYGEPDPEYGFDMRDECKAKLSDIVTGEKFKFVYEYDFGDGWEHDILVEKVLPPDPAQRTPTCIKGKRACPPEDVGGIWGYANFLDAINDPEHLEHEAYLEWIGGEFDPEAFDLNEINTALHEPW